jgi:hypothetical protein
MTAPTPRSVPGNDMRDVSQRSFGELMGEVSEDLSTVVRQELDLAKAVLPKTR